MKVVKLIPSGVRPTFTGTLLILSVMGSACAQDRAIVQLPGGSRFPVTGLVEDYTGKDLLIHVRSGEAPRRYLREDVIEVQTAYTVHHDKGHRLLVEGRVAEAKVELSAALNEEDRRWVRRQILADITRCALWNGNYRSAVSSFLPIVESDSETIHFDVIPLAWSDGPSPVEMRLEARSWMAEKLSIGKLIGASFLLFDREMNDEAESVLRKISREPGVKMQRLAQMQLWRVRAASGSPTPNELNRWEAALEEASADIRGGGYFVLGQAYKRQQEAERSAMSLLWLPLVFDADRHLAARACFEAAEQLESFGDTAQATNVYSEVALRFGDTPFGGRADARWQALRKGDEQQ